MHEYGWLHGNDFGAMMRVLEKTTNPRKLGLAACGFVRREWGILGDEKLEAAVETAEDYADYKATKQQVKAVRASLSGLIDETRERALSDKSAIPDSAWNSPDDAEWWWQFGVTWAIERRVELLNLILRRMDVGSLTTAVDIVRQLANPHLYQNPLQDLPQLCNILREIFGNPFRPIHFSSSWRTDTAIALARQMYESRDFGAMPILADALQDADCGNEGILNHCRDGNQAHVRGCWVVDLVLDKE